MSLPPSNTSLQADGRTTMELGAVLPKTAEVRDGHLFIGGVDMVELATSRARRSTCSTRPTCATAWSSTARRSTNAIPTPKRSMPARRS